MIRRKVGSKVDFGIDGTLNETTLESRMLRTYYDAHRRVFECGGRKLVVIAFPPLRFTVRSSELDLKNINAVWHSNFRGLCTDNNGSMRLPTAIHQIIGMHPSIKHLLYVLPADADNELVFCDMGSKSLKVLGTLDPDRFKSTARFQLQSWPTPLPLPPIQ